MARNLSIGDHVYVPCSKVEGLDDTGIALKRVRVVNTHGRSVEIERGNGQMPIRIASSMVHKDVGILIINIGDLETEGALLDPLAKSILQFCRLLVPDDQVRAEKVRSLAELKAIWGKNQAAYTHIVWVGHGQSTGIKFAVDGWLNLKQFAAALHVRGAPKKTYISLCCKTGYSDFGGDMSSKAICQYFIGPFHSVNGAVASQFCQTFLTSHLLDGKSAGVAFRKAREAVPGGVSFRLWQAGKLKTN